MAKNDYFVIAYRILRYLYECLKAGDTADFDYLTYETKEFPIGREYWNYVMKYLSKDGYISGVVVSKSLSAASESVKLLRNLHITPKGIEYLENNSAIQKAKNFLKELKETIPGI